MTKKKINQVEIRFPENRESLIEVAIKLDEVCVSVVGDKMNMPNVVRKKSV